MKPRVLYVDDEPHNLTALKRLFRHERFHFIIFSSPKAALVKIDEIKPAVVISDYRMPEMIGTLFLEAVKKRQPDSVRIILTGHADLEMAIAAINQDNVFRFIQKPWDDNELRAQLYAALDYHSMIAGWRAFEEKRTGETIIKKERLQAMHEIAITVRHELSQSMAVISGYSQLLQGHLDQNPLLSTYLSNIVLQIKKVGELTTKITSISGCETPAYLGVEKMTDSEMNPG